MQSFRFCPYSSVVERLLCKQRVVGSSPTVGTIHMEIGRREVVGPLIKMGETIASSQLYGEVAQLGEHPACIRKRVGSKPSFSTSHGSASRLATAPGLNPDEP